MNEVENEEACILKVLRRTLYLCINKLVLSLLSLFIRRRDDRVAFGSWCGARFVDNSRYLCEYLATTRPDLTLYWVGLPEIQAEVEAALPRVVFLKKDTLRSNIKLLSCRYFFFSQMHNADIATADVFRGATLTYLHHGMPIKKWAADGLNQGAPKLTLKHRFSSWLSGEYRKYDYFAISSALHGKSYETALAYKGYTKDRALPFGTPRNDMLLHHDETQITNCRRAFADSLGYDDNARVILYLPTYRRLSENLFSFSALSPHEEVRLDAILAAHNAVIVEKSHMAEKARFNYKKKARIKFADPRANAQEMLLSADALISDYSGAFVDYVLLDRPIIHYAYDYDHYKNVDSGLYYDIKEFAAGEVCRNFDELLSALSDILSGKDTYASRRAHVRKTYANYELGDASSRITQAVIPKRK